MSGSDCGSDVSSVADSSCGNCVPIVGNSIGTVSTGTVLAVQPHQEVAMKNVIPVAQKLERCASQLLPLLLMGDARPHIESILLEMTDLKDVFAELIMILTSGCQEFRALKTAFDMIAKKVDDAVRDRMPIEDLSFEIGRMKEILDALTTKTKKAKDFKEAQHQKPKVTAKFAATMMDKVSRDDSSKASQELKELKQKKKELQAEREKLTATISQARHQRHSSQSRVARATQIATDRAKDISALEVRLQQIQAQYAELQKKVDDKKAECGRVRERHSQMISDVLGNNTKKQGEIMEQSEAEKMEVDQLRRQLEGDLLPHDLAKLGKTYEGNHIILCCDQSGSMAGGKWQECVASVAAMYQPCGNHSFSLILFNNTKECLARDQPMAKFHEFAAKMNNFSPSGGTSFFQAWQEIKLVAKSSDQSRKHIIIFMTDGCTTEADTQAAAKLASETYQDTAGRMSTFIVPYDLGRDNFLMPIVKSGNGGKEQFSPVYDPSKQIPFLNKATMGELGGVFSSVKTIAENDVQAMREKIKSYRDQTSADITRTQEESLAKLQSNTDKRISGINDQQDKELKNLNAELSPMEEELKKKRAELTGVEVRLEKRRREDDGSLGQMEAECKKTDEASHRSILEATKGRDMLDEQEAALEAIEKTMWSRQVKIDGWFENEDSQNFASCVLAAFCDLQRSQDMVQHFTADMFDSAYMWIRQIHSELTKPTTCDFPREQQFQLLIKYYVDVVKVVDGKKLEGNSYSMVEDVRLIFTDMCRRSGRRLAEDQIQEALDILSTFDPKDFIFIASKTEDEYRDENRERASWLQNIQGQVRAQASMSEGRDELRKKQEAVLVKEDDVRRKRRKLQDLQERFGDDEDIKAAQEDYDQAAGEFVELRSARDQAMSHGSKHIVDVLGVVIQSIDNVLREKILASELKEIAGRVARYQALFFTEIMPFVQCVECMQQAVLSTDSKVWALPAPGAWRSATKAIVGEFAVVPREDSPLIEELPDDNPLGC